LSMRLMHEILLSFKASRSSRPLAFAIASTNKLESLSYCLMWLARDDSRF
jgi:hypothetical protein